MIKLGHFSQSSISPSETFIFDLVRGLNFSKNFELTFVSGDEKQSKIEGIENVISTGFDTKNSKLKARLHKIGQLKSKGDQWMWKVKKDTSVKALEKTNLPNFDVAFVEYATTGVLVQDYLVKKNIPFVVHVHGYDITSSLNDKIYVKELIKLFDTATFFIAPSNYMKRRLILLGCNPSKIKLIRYGINGKEIVPISWKDKLNENPSVIFLGRLTEKKHPIALLHAFYLVLKKVPNAMMSIIGNGQLESELKNTILSLGIDKSVKLYGVLPREKSFPIMNKHWLYAQHSVTSTLGDTEGFPISLAEAALHSLPIVSTVHNGIPENVIEGKTGYLVPEYDYELMAEKIIYLLQNPSVAEEMGNAGRAHLLEMCDLSKRIDSIKELLLSLS